MSAMGYQITGVSIDYSTICSDADQMKHQSSASLAFVKGGEFPARRARNQKMFPVDDAIRSDTTS